ncbi:MAG: D-alanyl-D-alanine carboxypeptidase/D-alanyl-D-alanine-endopeptidase [Bacteroidales bacterium]|nr:D-alanyl-D-alanine carboxypeptidase/D-alanyl-D-alanine-endopeptidase [Bacteroidales bacterium]
MNNLVKTIIVALLSFTGSATVALCHTSAQRAIERTGTREQLKSAAWGVFAMKMNGDTIADINRRQKMVPASNVKLLTTGLALKTLGPDFRFETGIGYSGEIEGSTLHGDLYIIGGGDPTTGSKADCAEQTASLFSKWVKFIKNAGIKKIEGCVVGDPRFFKCLCDENAGWLYEDIGSFDGAAPLGLNFYENTQKITIEAGKTAGVRPEIHAVYPEVPWMKFINNALTAEPNEPNTIFFSNTDLGPFAAINGKIPAKRGSFGFDCDNEFGSYTCAAYFHNYLKKNGISISGGYADIDRDGCIRTDLEHSGEGKKAAEDLNILGTTLSAPLSDIIDDTNRYSNNFFAETLIHTIAQKKEGTSEYKDCIKTAQAIFGTMGLKTKNSCKMVDGSGLSRKNYISPEFFVQFLSKMAKEQDFDVYFSSLPQPGVKGTMMNFMPKQPDEVKTRVHCKTGSMDGVLCYSGYICASNGNPDDMIVFSVMTNNSTSGFWGMRAAIEEIVGALCAEN